MHQQRLSISNHEVVYRDLGFPDADEMLAKAALASRLSGLIEKNAWSLPDAAACLNFSTKKLAAILRGQFRMISAEDLATAVTRLGAAAVASENACRSKA